MSRCPTPFQSQFVPAPFSFYSPRPIDASVCMQVPRTPYPILALICSHTEHGSPSPISIPSSLQRHPLSFRRRVG